MIESYFYPEFVRRDERRNLEYYDAETNPQGRVVLFSDAELLSEHSVVEQILWAQTRFKAETGKALESIVLGDKVWHKLKRRMVDNEMIESMGTPCSKIVNTGPYGAINFMGNLYGMNMLMPVRFEDS